MKRGGYNVELWTVARLDGNEEDADGDDGAEREMVAAIVHDKFNMLSVPDLRIGKVGRWIHKGWIPVDHVIYLNPRRDRANTQPVSFIFALIHAGMDHHAAAFMRAGAKPDYTKYNNLHGVTGSPDLFLTCLSEVIQGMYTKSLGAMLSMWKDLDLYEGCTRPNLSVPGVYLAQQAAMNGWAEGLHMILRSFPCTEKFFGVHESSIRCGIGCKSQYVLHRENVDKCIEILECVAWLGVKRVIPGMWKDILPHIVVPMMQTLTIAQIEGDYDNDDFRPNKIQKI